MVKLLPALIAFVGLAMISPAATPVQVTPVTTEHVMVIAAHPEAAAIGVQVLREGGNAIDAAVATSLALGVAEPFASGLGGKLMLLYYEAKSGRTYAVDAMDAAGAVNPIEYARRPVNDRSFGYPSVCVPGLPAGLWAAHRRWGIRKWASDVEPAITLARMGAVILPKELDLIAEQEPTLRRGDPEIRRAFLPGDRLPLVNSRLANPELAATMQRFAADGHDGFYHGKTAAAIVAAAQAGGGALSVDDFARYEARVTETFATNFRGYRIETAPPPSCGAALFLPVLKAFEDERFSGPLRTAVNLDAIGRMWRAASPEMWDVAGDEPQSRFLCEQLLAPASIAAIRAQAASPARVVTRASRRSSPFYESEMAATTHFVIVDGDGNIVSATQSLSMHFGAGVMAPGTGIVLNNSMSNFTFGEPDNINAVAPGKRARSTISPTIVFRGGKPVIALGLPGYSRIPTAMLQVLFDRLVLNRPLADAIGDTRVHFVMPFTNDGKPTLEAERSLPAKVVEGLHDLGWNVVFTETPGRGRYFGGVNAVEIGEGGRLTGYADPRRTNAAAGY